MHCAYTKSLPKPVFELGHAWRQLHERRCVEIQKLFPGVYSQRALRVRLLGPLGLLWRALVVLYGETGDSVGKLVWRLIFSGFRDISWGNGDSDGGHGVRR